MEKKKKKTPKQQYYSDIFDALMNIALRHPKPSMKVIRAIDEVADFVGDVATGRRR